VTDLSVSALVSRTSLALADLDVNDHSKYVVAGPMAFGGAVNWDRKQVNVPWVHGDFTVQRRMTNVTESITFYVAGTSIADLDTNLGAIKDAFMQDRYTFQLVVGGANHAWDCEAADVTQVLYDTAHVYNKYVAITFAVPRKPRALAGAL
jgi:hypothetical protein